MAVPFSVTRSPDKLRVSLYIDRKLFVLSASEAKKLSQCLRRIAAEIEAEKTRAEATAIALYMP